MEPDQIDIVASAVLGHLQEIENAQESRGACQLRRDVRKANRLDGIYDDRALLHPVAFADSDMRPRPDAHTACDFPEPHALPQPLGEYHGIILSVVKFVPDVAAQRNALNANQVVGGGASGLPLTDSSTGREAPFAGPSSGFPCLR